MIDSSELRELGGAVQQVPCQWRKRGWKPVSRPAARGSSPKLRLVVSFWDWVLSRTEHSGRRRPCSPESGEIPGTYVGFDPSLILETEGLVAAIAERRATAQDVYEWLEALLQSEPAFWRDARALREDRSRFLTRRALDLARVVLGNPTAGAERAGGRS